MATYDTPDLGNQIPKSTTYGHQDKMVGIFKGANAPTGSVSPAAGSILRVLFVPAFTEVDGLELRLDAATSSLTCKVGWAYVDGSSSDDDAFILASTAIATIGSFNHNSGLPPKLLEKDAYIIVTTAGATLVSTTQLTCIVDADFKGAP